MKSKKRYILPILFFVLVASVVHAESGAQWQSAMNKDGIEVFTRPVEGSDVDEFMGVTIIDAKIEVIEAVQQDVPSQTQWLADCKEARLIKKLDDTSMVVFHVTKAPWPLSDRELLSFSRKNRDYKSGTVVIDFSPTDTPSVPVKDGNVRITELKGQWAFSYIDRNHTKVSYSIKCNPGGSIPKSIANMTSKNIPYNTLLGMKKMVKLDRYIETANVSKESKEIESYITAGYLKP